MLMKEILKNEVHHHLRYHYYPDLQLDDRYSYGQTCCCHFSKQKMLPAIKPPATPAKPVSEESSGGRKAGYFWPLMSFPHSSAGKCISKEYFNEPRLLQLLIHRKTLKSLT